MNLSSLLQLRKNPEQQENLVSTSQVPHLINNIIEQTFQDLSTKIYYMPAYVRLKIKNFLEIGLETLSAEVLSTINITICMRGFKEYIISESSKQRYNYLYELLTTKFMLQFSRDQSQMLNKNSEDLNVKFKQNDEQFTFTIWKNIGLNVIPKNFWLSPFQLVDLKLILTLNQIKGNFDGVNFIFKFNCMDTQNTFVKLSYPEIITYGQYTIAKGLIQTYYHNNKKKKDTSQNKKDIQDLSIKKKIVRMPTKTNSQLEKTKQQNLSMKMLLNQQNPLSIQPLNNQSSNIVKKKPQFKQWQYAHFILPIYRTPIVDLLTVFIPLWLLGLLNIFVFFQDNVLGDRIANIAAIMIAFVALIPTIRSQIPPKPKITLVQAMIYLQICTCLLAMIQSYLLSTSLIPTRLLQQDSSTSTNYTTPVPSSSPNVNTPIMQNPILSNYLYLVTVGVNCLTFTVIIILFIIFYCYWKPKYDNTQFNQDQSQFHKDDKNNWYQQQCNETFSKYIDELKKWRIRKKQFDLIYVIKEHQLDTCYEQY